MVFHEKIILDNISYHLVTLSIPKVAKNGQKEPFQQTFLKMNATTFFMHIHGFYDIYCITRVYFEGCMYIINEYKPKITKNAIIIEQFREKLIENTHHS